MQYQYDTYGRLQTRIDFDGRQEQFVYRSDNLLQSYTDRSGKVIQYSYDAAKRLMIESFADEQISYTYDKLGRVTGRSNAGGQITYTYDTLGRLLSENQNGEGVEYDYTVDGELSTVTAQEWLVSYSRDAAGRITEWQGDGEGRSYQYDQASRLTRVSHAGGAQENYGYDGLSNRTNNQAQYDAANRLLEDSLGRYTYDLSGNMTTKVSKLTGQKEVYQYNARNLLVAYRRYASETDTEPQQQASYTYDALSRRTSKTVDGVTTEFVWAGDTMIAEKQGTTIRRYFYDGLTPILMEEGGQTYQFQTDHLATPRQMTDTLGNVMWTARLDAYGKVTTETGTVVNNLRFPGQYHDRETGLYYNWHRYYSPELGRYITSDPIGLVGGLNTYAYVGGNPVGAVDPMGLETEIIIWQPVGWGSSSFGHVSGQVNGVNYSFGPGGWDSNKSFAAYVERQQQFRSGTGVKLNLSAPEEHEFEQCLKNSGGEYDSIQNNCGTPFKDCLNYVGKKVGYPLFPADIGDNLLESPLYNGTTHYPGPTRSWWRDNWFTQ